MLSPGDYHQHVPKDLRQNLIYRRWLLKQCEDPNVRRGVMEACRLDFFFWLNSFGWQFNPDTAEVGPFISWDRVPWLDNLPDQQTQEEAARIILGAIEDRKSVRWQKSREVGASWLVLFIIVWLCNFHQNIKGLAMSRDEPSVDDPDDPDSLFWKVRFIHSFLPEWMRGPLKKQAGKRDARPGIRERSSGFAYEKSHSFFNGTANVESAGVGGRARVMLLDEFGQFKKGHEIYSMTSDTSHCRIFVGTHKDNAGMFYQLCFDVKYSGMREILTHWSQHPVKGRGVYRYNEASNSIEVLDKSFDFASMCSHSVPKSHRCQDCGESGRTAFKFVMESKPVGGPFPGIRSPWYDQQCKERTERDVSMNLDIDPRGATDKFFDAYRINLLIADHARPPVWTGTLKFDKETGRALAMHEDAHGLLKLWFHPKGPLRMPTIKAGTGVDIAAGSGASPSCLSLINAQTGQKLLEYADALIYPNDFAAYCVALWRLFEDADGLNPLAGWEMQGGGAFGRRVRELGYSPIYIRSNEDSLVTKRDTMRRPGINQSKEEIMVLMNSYRDGLYDQRLINPSAFALEECLQFVYSGITGVEYRGRRSPMKTADPGSGATFHHGDMPKADAIAWKMVKELGGAGRVREEDDPNHQWNDPRTLAGRMALADEAAEMELVWR